jgi:hypothetical protein
MARGTDNTGVNSRLLIASKMAWEAPSVLRMAAMITFVSITARIVKRRSNTVASDSVYSK